jgi:transcriptional regulator with GAF, ATPase, and Fis domain
VTPFLPFLPAFGISVHQYLEDANAFQMLAIAWPNGVENVDLTFNLPPQLEDFAKWQATSNIKLINNLATDPVVQQLIEVAFPYFQERNLSTLAMRLDIKGSRRIADVCLYAKGGGQYLSEHACLFAMLNKPLAIAVANFLTHRKLELAKERLTKSNQYLGGEMIHLTGPEIIGGSSGLRKVIEAVRQIAHLNTPVFLTGKTGVGKELVANAIQQHSQCSDGPFIKMNCGAIPESVLDSELFGHEKGAFTGAIQQRPGRFELADGGTIFLDEIGEMPLSVQVRLLRVLQDGHFERVGGITPVKTNIRVIVATHHDIPKMIQSGQFREDLYFRLNVFPIHIPPLRERQDDIPALIQYFVKKKCLKMNRPIVNSFDQNSIKQMMNYPWPGNVRELENIVERSLILHSSGPLSFPNLTIPNGEPTHIKKLTNEVKLSSLDEVNIKHITAAIVAARGKIQGPHGAAEILKINANTLRKRMIKLRIPFGRISKK